MTVTTTACRRQTVTVLFVDIVGYTALIDELDCAEVHALQTDYFATVAARLRAAGGVVEKYVGDAVMAIFDAAAPYAGAAVRAALELQGDLTARPLAGRHPVRTRVGLATGEVILDPVAARDGGYGMVSGRVVATAARLQQYAPHDTVVVCADTHRATEGLVAYQELPPVVVAGRSRPVELWRALHPRPAPYARRAERLQTAGR